MPERLKGDSSEARRWQNSRQRATVREVPPRLAVDTWLFERDAGARPERPHRVFLSEVEGGSVPRPLLARPR